VLQLSTERLLLSPLTTEHLVSVHELWVQPSVRRYLWDDEIISLERAAEPLKASARNFQERGFGLWGLYLHATHELVGFCGLRVTNLFPEPELLFAVADRWQRQGLGYEAGLSVLAYAFGPLALARVGAVTDPPNISSQRLLERLGMHLVRRAGHAELDMLFYGLDRARWQSSSAVHT
jgi:ribosomal-protein-alanine N-acetyltransferase